MDFGRRAGHALLEHEAPTAFVCVSDTVAMGVLQALKDSGRTAGPEDVAVVGFDDSLAAQVTGLTSVRQPLEEVAVQVVRLLDDRLSLRSSDEPHVILTPELQLRATS
jgi:LacI family transcriptional regulator